MQEEILLKKSRKGTTVVYFDTNLSLGERDSVPSVVLLDQQGRPKYINQFDGNEVWIRNSQNNLVQPNEYDQYYTGHSYSDAFNFVFSEEERDVYRQNFLNEMEFLFEGASQSFVFFHDSEVDDLFVTTNLVRTRDFLDTLNVYNNLVNSFPEQESKTGTLMGTLNALQNIRDESGNKVKIPLANVPVGVFIASDEFPTIGSLDSQGDRITLNLKEGSSQGEYFDTQSYNQDTTEYLRSGSRFETIPDHYKHFTYTNDNGEFILNNVPIGGQVLLFEVDLFKQGLTKDEIALNNFPFPVDEEPNLDTIPSLFYRQIPLDVIQNWGVFQTGYTEININVNLDLRKWTTFYTTPISYQGKTLEELQAKGYNSPLTFEIRDMSLEGYPIKNKEIVEIHSMYDREEDSRIFWYNEFAQRKKSAQFRTRGYHAFKVPANMYDPEGERTDSNGNPTGKKGVWLAGYQISQHYISKETIFRHTGLEKVLTDESTYVTRDHFNLNKNNTTYNAPNSEAQGVIGQFPYEKPWSVSYPEKYKIPRKPTEVNPNYQFLDDEGRKYIERPRYLDGDLVGRQFSDFSDSNNDSPLGGTGGYGVARDSNSNSYYKNNFSKTVTQNFIYKYEQGVNENEKYSNGYKPNTSFPVDDGVSSVLNGEKYQRVECGYGYWLRPEGMPRIYSDPVYNGSEVMLDTDTENPNSLVTESQASGGWFVSVAPYENSVSVGNFEDGTKILLEMGGDSKIPEGSLDIYRILDPSPYNLVNPDPVPKLQFVKLNFQRLFSQRGKSSKELRPEIKNSGNDGGQKFWSGDDITEGNYKTMINLTLKITNKGVVSVDFMGIATLDPNQSYDISLSTFGKFDWLELELPTNSIFDFEEFKYTKARYDFEWQNITLYNGGNNINAGLANLNAEGAENFSREIRDVNLAGGDENDIPNFYLRTELINCATNYSGDDNECTDDFKTRDDYTHTIEINGMALVNPEQENGVWFKSHFTSSKLEDYTCNVSGGPSGLIPFKVIP